MKNTKNVVVKQSCHSRGMLSGIYNVCRYHNKGKNLLNKYVEDPRLRLSGMTPNLMGFTLIELLVVVLIIGILAAVAVPQYQKAVEKSKATQVFPILEAVYKAQLAYYLANGEYATQFSQLDVEIPFKETNKWVSNSLHLDVRSNQDWSIQLYKDAQDSRAVSAGRLNGSYKGAGFFIYFKGAPSYAQNGELLCAERKSGGINFEDPAGRYCNKLFNGIQKETGNLRTYQLP